MMVIDASIILAWLIPEESSALADEALTKAKLAGPLAPPLLALEVANALRSKLRRGEIDVSVRDQALTAFDRLGVVRDTEGLEIDVLRETVRLSDLHGLTAYDAAYLETAIRRQAGLATLDADLRRAAQAEGVDVYPPRN